MGVGWGWLPRVPGGRRFWGSCVTSQMRRGGCDVPVVASFAVHSRLRCEIKWMEVWRLLARRIPAAGEPLEGLE